MEVPVRVHEDFDLGGGYALTQGIHSIPLTEIPNYETAILDGRMFFFKQSTDINDLNQQVNEQVYSLYRSDIENRNVLYLSDFGGIGDDETDNTDAFQAAFDALAEDGGGTLELPRGICRINNEVNKVFYAAGEEGFNDSGAITIRGGAVRFVSEGGSSPRFYFINLSSFVWENIEFYGEPDVAAIDCRDYGFTFGGTTILSFRKCGFKGIMSDNISNLSNIGFMMVSDSRQVLFDGCDFGGSTAIDSTLLSLQNCRAIKFLSTTFIDFNNDKNCGIFTKTSGNVSEWSWVKIFNDPATRCQIEFDSFFFDEAARYALDIDTADNLTLRTGFVNVPYNASGISFKTTDVKNTLLQKFHATDAPSGSGALLLRALGSDFISVDSVTLGGGATTVEHDGAEVEVINSPDLVLEVI